MQSKSLHRYLDEKIAIGVISDAIPYSAFGRVCGITIYGVSSAMWERVLEPEIRRLVPIARVFRHEQYVRIKYRV